MWESLKKPILYLLIASGVWTSLSALIYSFKLQITSWMVLLWLIMLIYFMIYLTSQVYFVWYLYCRFKKPMPNETIRSDFSVDVFFPAYNEPMWVVERALKAAKKITYPHKTYLLDDSPDDRYEQLAKRLNTEYLTRNGNLERKAGNINAALGKTSGDLIAIFDIDHAPLPDFLDRSLGFFEDPQIGIVQVMQTFCNAKDGLIAEASVQTSLEYFNITAVCKDNVGAMSHHGSNAVIRRKALESIGGYQPGLAEDLETSLDLHAKWWKSKYVCEPLAPGLAPADFRAFCKQQLKWSRGVFEAALRSFLDGTFLRLTWHQRLAYSVRYSYYLVGLSALLGMTLTLYYLIQPSADVYEGFMARFLPFMAIAMGIRWYMMRIWGTEPMAKKGFYYKGTSLVFSTWPVYLVSLIFTITRIKIPFMSTPKEMSDDIELWTVIPQTIMIIALSLGILWKMLHWHESPAPLTVILALMLIGQHWILVAPIRQVLRKRVLGIKHETVKTELRATSNSKVNKHP